eukprot:TRINITY_DN1966_c0_g2_i9.p1 TRINITY_DN1966_c0_g2~~TRINITY_DN1966_c0_g2_i9.p1  ORF type:complete len:263 (-),score=60.90 TRINITY_DN1966_c0_g2_i9:553-1341(-)
MPLNKDNKSATDNCIKKLADMFSIDIVYYKDSAERVFENKNRIFAAPLVVCSDKNEAFVMYTRGQARLFADNEAAKRSFSKEAATKEIKKSDEETAFQKKLLQEANKKLEEAMRMKEELDKQAEKMKSYKEAANLLSEVLEDFVKKVADYNKAIKNFSTNRDLAAFNKVKEKLMSSKLFTKHLENDESLRELYSKFSKDIPTLKAELKGDGLSKALERLNSQQEDSKQTKSENCQQCTETCDYYNGIKLKCGHILDFDCLEE